MTEDQAPAMTDAPPFRPEPELVAEQGPWGGPVYHHLRAAGCEKVFAERVSSVGKRAQLDAALEYLREGDVLMVYSRTGSRAPSPTCSASWTSSTRKGWRCASCPWAAADN